MSMDGSSDRSNVCREERHICIQGVSSSKSKILSLLDGRVQCSHPATRVLAGHLREQCHISVSLLLADWALSGDCKQVSIGEWEVHVAEPLNNLHPLHHVHFHHWSE
jgi:hypothetical protein